MDKEHLILKWLSGELTDEERAQFKALPESEDYENISKYAEAFKKEPLDHTEGYREIQLRKSATKQSKNKSWMFKAAAILIIAVSVSLGLFINSSDKTEIIAMNAEHDTLTLPEQSIVYLNSSSKLTYDKDHWKKERLVNLTGEAFFKVAKGSRFEVKTNEGSVIVKGTQFNVYQRDQHFSVDCYEGKVAIEYKGQSTMITAGQSWTEQGKRQIQTTGHGKPAWLNGRSEFNSVSLERVFQELERQYNIEIQTKKLTFDTKQRFTGSFDHFNLDQALKTVLLPFDLTYKKTGKTISILNSDD